MTPLDVDKATSQDVGAADAEALNINLNVAEATGERDP